MLNKSPVIVVDTSVLINFLHIDRMDLIANHSHDFVITDHVRGEIIECYKDQYIRLEKSIENKIIYECSLLSSKEIELFAKLIKNGRIGVGEASAITCSICGGHKLAIDDRRAIKETIYIAPKVNILRTEDMLLSMLSEKLLSIEESDEIKVSWETQYKFKLKIASFQELLERVNS